MKDLLLVGAGLLLAAFVVLAVRFPRVSLLTLVALDVSNINGVIADQVGISPYKPQLAIAVVVVLVMVRRRMFRFRWSPVLLGTMVLFAGFCVSFVAAADPVTSQDVLLGQARDMLYFVVVYALLLSTDQIKAVAAVAVFVLAGLAGLTVIHEFLLHNSGSLYGLSRVPLVQEGGALTPRHAGTSSDVNFWARLLILFTPLSLSLLAISRSWRDRVLWGGCFLALLLGVYLTQSRGGFIALFVGLVVWALLAGGHYRKSLLYLPIALIVLVPLTGIGSRLGTLSAIVSGSTNTADPSVVTRKRFQLDAWNMFLDSPITGHGIGSYGTLFPRYDRVANFYEPVTIVVAAHNFYLEQAADGGIILLLCWAFFFGSVVFVCLRTLIRAPRASDHTDRFLAVGILGGLTGWLIASVFLHLSDFRALLVIAAIAAAVDVRSRTAADPSTVDEAADWAADLPLDPLGRRPSRALVAGLASVAALGLVGLTVVIATENTFYTSSTTLGVAPSGAVNGANAYGLDVVSRGLIVPTITEVLDRSIGVGELQEQAGRFPNSVEATDASVSFAESRLGGAVVVTVTADQPSTVAALTTAAVTLSKAQVANLQMGYELTGDPVDPQTISTPAWWWMPTLTVITVGFAGLAIVADRRRISWARSTVDLG